MPTWYDLQVLESVHKALRPLLDFTDTLSGEDYVTVSSVKSMLSLFNTDTLAPQEEDTDLTKSIKSSILEYLIDNSDPETTYIEHNKIQEVKSQAVDEIGSLLANTQSESDMV